MTVEAAVPAAIDLDLQATRLPLQKMFSSDARTRPHSESPSCRSGGGSAKFIANASLFPHGRGCGVGRGLGVALGVAVGVTVAVGVGVTLGVTLRSEERRVGKGGR